MSRSRSLPPEYFESIYQRNADPWQFETSSYEKNKYRLTLQSMPGATYRNGLEIGCSIGVLTERLAALCKRLLALDVSQEALDRALARCAHLTGVRFRRMQVPGELPDECFDLIVLSEVGYYWQMADLERAADGLCARHPAGGHLVLVHLTEYVPDHPLSGDEVHDYWMSRPEWRQVCSTRQPRFRLDVLERASN